jgi:membrane protein YdbS with pleckstrin-like domain
MYDKEKDELMLKLAPNKYKWIAALLMAVFSILAVWYTYKAHTKPPDSFSHNKKLGIFLLVWSVFFLPIPFDNNIWYK